MSSLLVSVFCPDRTGLVAAITGRLFELGANLGDASFALLGTGSEFTAIAQVPDHIGADALEIDLANLPELAGAAIRVSRFGLDADHGPAGRITHVVTVAGGDRPGLVVRLAETFAQFHANIVRMDAHSEAGTLAGRYVTRFAVFIPPAAVTPCLNTVANTAGELGLACQWQASDA
jgi:glycine cleavage system transcriptional repressor